MNLALKDSLATWKAGGPLPQDIVAWAKAVHEEDWLIATTRRLDEEIMLGAENRRDGQKLLLEACRTEAGVRARIMIVLSNGRTIARDLDLNQNRLSNNLYIDPTPNSAPGSFTTITSVPHPISPGPNEKKLKIDCSEGSTRGDIIVTMESIGLTGYYAFERIPTKLVKEEIDVDGKKEKRVIGEEPYPVLHFWDYLTGRPLSIHLKKFLTQREANIPACIIGSLPGGIPVHAELPRELIKMYQEIFDPKADSIRSRYANR